jgi:hypothetical protein
MAQQHLTPSLGKPFVSMLKKPTSAFFLFNKVGNKADGID